MGRKRYCGEVKDFRGARPRCLSVINAQHLQRARAQSLTPGLGVTNCSEPFAIRICSVQVPHIGRTGYGELSAHFLETGSKRVNLLLLARYVTLLTLPG